MEISIIVLTFNSEKQISKCIESLIAEKIKNSEIIIIDNNSSDRTKNIIKNLINKNQYKLKFILNAQNLGFSAAINKGIKKSKGKNILIVNPDTVIFRNSINKLLKCLIDNNAGIVGGKLLKKGKGIHGSFVRKPDILTGIFDFTNLRKIIPTDYFHRKHYYLDEKIPKKAKEVDAVSGAFMLLTKNVINNVGYFDENFFMYLEDIDFCIRAKQAGYKVLFNPNSTIYHEGGASSINKDKINYSAWSKSRRYYFKKHFSIIENIIIQPLFYLDDLISKLWRIIR